MLTVKGLSVRYGPVLAVDGLDLVVPDGEIVAILGPSGSGKTSVLRAVAGLEPVAAGTVRWDDTDLTTTPPHRRDFGLMFQDHALFGHQDVAANVAFGLRTRGWSASDRNTRTAEMLALVGLAGTGDAGRGPALRRRAAAGGARPRPRPRSTPADAGRAARLGGPGAARRARWRPPPHRACPRAPRRSS